MFIGGFLLSWLFEFAHNRGDSIRQSFKVIITLSTAFLMMAFETRFEGIIPMSGLPAIMSMACMILIALVFRSAGVLICLIGTNLNIKEKLLKLSQ